MIFAVFDYLISLFQQIELLVGLEYSTVQQIGWRYDCSREFLWPVLRYVLDYSLLYFTVWHSSVLFPYREHPGGAPNACLVNGLEGYTWDAADKIKELSSLAFSSLLLEGQRNETMKVNLKCGTLSSYGCTVWAEILLPGFSFTALGWCSVETALGLKTVSEETPQEKLKAVSVSLS